MGYDGGGEGGQARGQGHHGPRKGGDWGEARAPFHHTFEVEAPDACRRSFYGDSDVCEGGHVKSGGPVGLGGGLAVEDSAWRRIGVG